MANLGKVVYLTEAQLQTLFTNGTITVDGVTVTYSANDLYVTPVPPDGMIVENVSGTTPTITGVSNTRYICGECSTLSITAPASGCIDVMFTSGTTPTVLTATSAKTGVSAIKWANGFDPSTLDASTTYEINILDGEFGVSGSWT